MNEAWNLEVPLAMVGLPVRDAQGRQVGHVVSARWDSVGTHVHAHLSDPPQALREVGSVPRWVRGRRVDLEFPA